MTNIRNIEKMLRNKGIKNIEVTKDKKTYYVLHILKNGNPVPLFTTTDKSALSEYLESEYGIKLGKGWHGDTPGHKAAAAKKKLSSTAREPLREPDWKKVAKKELETKLAVKTVKRTYKYYEELGALALESTSGEANNGEKEWIIFKDQEAAEEAAIAHVKYDLEEEPEIFNQDWLLSQIDDKAAESTFREIYDDWNSGYAHDIMSEDDDEYTNRLASEMVSVGIISEEEGKDKKFDLESKIDLFVEHLTDDQINEGGGGYEHYRFNFGDDEAKKIIMDNNLIDIDAAAEDAVNTDGVAHFLDVYDGSGVDLQSGAVAFGTN